MVKYLVMAKQLIEKFQKFSIRQISMNKNAQEDALSKLSSACLSQIDRIIYFEIKEASSVIDGEMVM